MMIDTRHLAGYSYGNGAELWNRHPPRFSTFTTRPGRMIMSLEWSNLRTLDGARNAFEELCCQLARGEAEEQGFEFERKGTPDGGVECYAMLPSGGNGAGKPSSSSLASRLVSGSSSMIPSRLH